MEMFTGPILIISCCKFVIQVGFQLGPSNSMMLMMLTVYKCALAIKIAFANELQAIAAH